MAKEKTALETVVAKERKVTGEDAQLLARIGLSQAEGNAAARKILKGYFKQVLAQQMVSADDARAALNILQNSSTTEQKNLCNEVLSRFLANFPAEVEPVKAEKVPAKA